MHELWITKLLKPVVSGPADLVLQVAGYPSEKKLEWMNAMSMEILVIVLLMLVAVLLRPRLSVDRPGKFQLVLEAIYGFLRDQAHEVVGHGYKKNVPFFAMLFIFILASNLIGIIPTFESPTMFYFVPAGIALCSFVYYNTQGIQEMGVLGHLKHFAGPLWWLWWFMFPLELISHCIRPVSLTIRLFANMLAGEQVTLGFLALVPVLVPVAVMGLHVFVSFLQAFIFTVLNMVYVGGVVAHEDH
jgi:F-type H+-transporting ATPase subunit a